MKRKKANTRVYVSLIGTADFNNHIADYLLNKFGIKIYKRPVKKFDRDIFYTLVIGGAARSLAFLDWIYKNASIYLDRKHERYLKLREDYRFNKKMHTSEFKYELQ